MTIVRRGVKLVVRVLAGMLLGALALNCARNCRRDTADPERQRHAPPPPDTTESGAVGA